MRSPIKSRRPEDAELSRKREELTELQARLAELELQLLTLRLELAESEALYHAKVINWPLHKPVGTDVGCVRVAVISGKPRSKRATELMRQHLWSNPKLEWEGFTPVSYWFDHKVWDLPLIEKSTDGGTDTPVTVGVYQKLEGKEIETTDGLKLVLKAQDFNRRILETMLRFRQVIGNTWEGNGRVMNDRWWRG